MSNMKKDLENLNSNWDYGIRSSNLWERISGLFLRVFFNRQVQLNASMVRILNSLIAEKSYRIYCNRDTEIKPSDKGFDYFGFESVFRPAEEIIKERQKRYLAFFKGKGPVIDIGCGRGEFLELLKEEGIDAIGVDINEDMLDRCTKKGFNVVKSDFMEYMTSMPDGSAGGVFSAQFVEHIPFERLDAFFKASYKKLAPGGVMVAETINPYHPAAFRSFFVDPTHVKPLYPEVLEFLCRSAGFQNVSVVFVPGVGVKEGDIEEPREYTDYAVIAKKQPLAK